MSQLQQIQFCCHCFVNVKLLLISKYKLKYHFKMYNEMMRQDSMTSTQQSQKVQIYFTALNFTTNGKAILEVLLSQADKPLIIKLKTNPVILNNAKVQFSESLVIEYFFEIRQKLVLRVYDSDYQKTLLGMTQATIGQIFNGRQKGIVKDVVYQNQKIGKLHLMLQKIDKGSNRFIQFDLVSRNVEVGSVFLCFGETDSLWRMYKKTKNNQQYLIYNSQHKPGANNRYNHIKISQRKLCNCDDKQPIIIKFFNRDQSHPIGQTIFTLANLRQSITSFTLMRRQKQKGKFTIQNFKETVEYDFVDYYTNGMDMAMVVCIDFTASNGILSSPSSKHFFSQNQPSMYERALHEVCSIVLDYDKDKLVPVFGFGAKVNLPNFNTGTMVHHCFPLNGSTDNPNAFQVAEIKNYYRSCAPNLLFSGPTLFAPLLKQAMNICQQMKERRSEYMILMIMTDGMIHDKAEVIDLLVACGQLPLSIIIIGIGNNQEQWQIMHQLDDDDCQMVDSKGHKTKRDLVQFVQFSKHNNNGVQLARQVLEELPRQVVEYNKLVGLTPQSYFKNKASNIGHMQSQRQPQQQNVSPYS